MWESGFGFFLSQKGINCKKYFWLQEKLIQLLMDYWFQFVLPPPIVSS